MTDKEKIRKEVEKLKSQLLRGACSSQIAMETMCKEEAYNEVLAILDTMQEEPKQCMYSKDNYTEEDRKVLCEGCEEKCEFNQVKESAILQHKEEMCKENGNSLTQEPVSKEIGDYDHKAVMESLYPELKEEPVSEELENAANEWNTKASFTPFYMTLDDKGNPNGVRQDYTTHAESFKAGAQWDKEQMMAKAIDGYVIEDIEEGNGDFLLSAEYIPKSMDLKDRQKVKVIVIRED